MSWTVFTIGAVLVAAVFIHEWYVRERHVPLPDDQEDSP